MGAYSSTHLTPEEIEEMVTVTNFNNKEIEQLYHRFKKLDRSRSGIISRQDFQLVSELSLNPMAHRILSLFQTEAGCDAVSAGGVTFDIFVRTLNFFHPSTPWDKKLEVMFRAYDVDGDGVVSERDLVQMLKYYVGPHLSDTACKVLVRKTMDSALQSCSPADAEEKQRDDSADAQRKLTTPTPECAPPRGLRFADFSRLIGKDGMDALEVHVPLRHDE